MTIERLEQIEADLENDKIMRSPVLHIIAAELITDNRRLRGALNKIQGKAKEALDG